MTANALKQEKDRVSVFAFIAMFTHAFQTPNCLTGTWSSAVSQLSDPKATKFMFRSMILSEERLKLSQIRQIQRWTQRSVLVCDRGVDGFDDNASTGEKP